MDKLKILPRVVLFDWDGTLVDTHHKVTTLMDETLSDFHLPSFDESAVKMDRQKSLMNNFSNLFGDKAGLAYQKYVTYYTGGNSEKVSSMPGAKEVLSFLQERVIIAIASNKDRQLLEYERKTLFPAIHFKKITCGNEAIHDKPHRDFGLAALQGLIPIDIISENTVWMVGDSAQDIQQAVNLNVKPILIKGGFLKEQTFPPQTLIFKDLFEFLHYLEVKNV